MTLAVTCSRPDNTVLLSTSQKILIKSGFYHRTYSNVSYQIYNTLRLTFLLVLLLCMSKFIDLLI